MSTRKRSDDDGGWLLLVFLLLMFGPVCCPDDGGAAPLCPVALLEPSGAFDAWVAAGCEGFGCSSLRWTHWAVCRTCRLGPDHPVGEDGPWLQFEGLEWSPPEAGLWSVLREARWDNAFGSRIVRMWWWQEPVAVACLPAPAPPLFVDGFESGNVSAWSRSRPVFDPDQLFADGFESGGFGRWSRVESLDVTGDPCDAWGLCD